MLSARFCFSRRAAFVACLAVSLLAACAQAPRSSAGSAKPAGAPAFAMLRFANVQQLQRLAGGIVLQVETQQGQPVGQYGFRPLTLVPGRYASFPIRFDLAPGAYRIVGLLTRAGDRSAGDVLPNVALHLDFEIKKAGPAYLGRIEMPAQAREDDGGVTASAGSIEVFDAYAEDLPELAQAWPELRSLTLSHRLATKENSAAEPASSPVAQIDNGHYTAPVKLDRSDGEALPAAARPAFRQFLAKPLPRVFALTAEGRSIVVSGSQALRSALEQCRKSGASNRKPCRVYAIDDTLFAEGVLLPLAAPTAVPARAASPTAKPS